MRDGGRRGAGAVRVTLDRPSEALAGAGRPERRHATPASARSFGAIRGAIGGARASPRRRSRACRRGRRGRRAGRSGVARGRAVADGCCPAIRGWPGAFEQVASAASALISNAAASASRVARALSVRRWRREARPSGVRAAPSRVRAVRHRAHGLRLRALVQRGGRAPSSAPRDRARGASAGDHAAKHRMTSTGRVGTRDESRDWVDGQWHKITSAGHPLRRNNSDRRGPRACRRRPARRRRPSPSCR